MSENTMILFVLVGLPVLALMIVGLVASLFQQRERMLTHTERMKTLELGLPLPEDPKAARIKARSDRAAEATAALTSASEGSTSKSFAYQCYSTTGWVSGCGLLFAAGAGAPIAYAIAAAAGAVGVTGMICGTVLAAKEIRTEPSMTTSKPRFDPEAV